MCSAPFLAVLLFSVAVLVCSETLNDTETLLSDLFTGYNNKLRGTFDQTKTVHVNISFVLFTIESLNVVEQSMTAMIGISARWLDERLSWDPSNYNGTAEFTVPKDQVWVPEIAVGNPAKEVKVIGLDGDLVFVDISGIVHWIVVHIFTSRCPANVANFPMDTQTCPIRFVVAGRSMQEVTLYPGNLDSSRFEISEEWDLISTAVYTDTIYDISTVAMSLTLKRHPAFVFVNYVCPVLLIGLLNICVFLIPAESGERISFCITVFLSLALFMTFISNQLPSNSRTMAIVCYSLLLSLPFSMVAAFMVIMNLRLYFRDDTYEPVPSYITSFISKIGCCKNGSKPPAKKAKNYQEVTVVENVTPADVNVNKVEQAIRESDILTWRYVSYIVDKGCMLVMFLCYVILTLATLVFIATK